MKYLKRYISVVFFIFMSLNLLGQENLIDSIINTKEFYNRFLLYHLDKDNMILYDRSKILKKDHYYSIDEKIMLSKDSIYELFYQIGGIHYRYKPKNLIVMFPMQCLKDDNIYVILFWRPYTGSMLKVKFIKRKEKYIFIDFEL